jgi:hypothetical protein
MMKVMISDLLFAIQLLLPGALTTMARGIVLDPVQRLPEGARKMQSQFLDLLRLHLLHLE